MLRMAVQAPGSLAQSWGTTKFPHRFASSDPEQGLNESALIL